MNVYERNKKISYASQNLEEMFHGIHHHETFLTQEDIDNLKQEVKNLLEAVDGYPVLGG
jgi:hypothetical protein